uniref:RNA-directed DNA polymerase, eukaryota n=1 Tax=Tanacetum cinerariifolium TaxID=118510 RepID=A0A699H9V8_TANCI|nr:RNA-directed DNA polymerase, eukaryota [Tanacetum cinerariifolium]
MAIQNGDLIFKLYGDRRSKEDGIHNISTSIFVTNFPDQTNTKELWRFGNPYRNVIDAFIPDRRLKIGKRFGFIRFTRVADVNRLINNLCTIWIGKFKLHTNIVRFNILPLNKGSQHAANTAKDVVEESKPSMVLDHSCYNNFDSSLSLNTFDKISSKWGSLLHEEEEDDSYFHKKCLCIKTSIGDNIFESFKMIVKGKTYCIRDKEVTGSAPKFFDNQDVSFDFDVGSEDVNDDALSENGKEDSHSEADIIPKTVFEKGEENVTVSNYFIAIMGKWLPSDRNLLIISVYAPQELLEKWMLWQYLNHIINGWKGDVIIMGDFNEGFDSFVANTWRRNNILESNAMLKLIKKLKLLKDKGEATSPMLDERLNIINDLTSLENNVSLELAQKAKIKWAIEGDENSILFHGIINKHRNNLAVRGIIVDGEWIEEPNAVKNNFFPHFRDRFDRPCKTRLTLDMEFPNKLSTDQSHYLERPFSMEEVKGAVWGCDLNKSPGPDGFTFKFYRRYWSLIKDDVLEAVNYFFQNGYSQKRDSPFMLNEIIHWCKSKKKQTIIFKVDFEKAFDSVRWDFLDDVMANFGFGTRWRDWILSCLKSSRGSILVNGSPTMEFQFYKGLKQGDLLSPFLFILVMESLNLSLHNVVSAGLFKRVNLDNLLQLSHLFYACVVVFVGQWCDSNLFTIIRVLDYFFRASGLCINLHKSKLIGIAVDQSMVEAAASNIGCMALNLPFSYLGIIIGIDNDIYSTVDACLNACEMWKAIKSLKQGELINVQDLETNLYWKFGKFTSQDGESLESYYSRFYKKMDEIIRNQCNVTNHQVNVRFLLQQQPEWQRFVTLVKQSQELKTVSYHKLYDILKQHQNEVNEIKAERIARVANPLALVAQQQPVYRKAIVNSPQPIYDQEASMVAEDDETLKDKEIDKLMALISLSFKKIYKPTNNNLRTSSNTSRENQDNSLKINRSTGYKNQRIGNVAGARETVARECQKPKRVKDAAYHREKMLLCKQEEAGIQLNAEQADWRDETDDDELEDQELEAHYMYTAQLQEVSPDAANSGPIFDDEPLQKVSNDDYYNVFAIESKHPEQSESVHDTYPIEQDAHIVIIDSLDMSYYREEIDQNDDIMILPKNVKLKISKTKNKSLESSNNHFKEANNKLSETNNLLYTDYKKSEAELARRNSMEYASQMEIECAKVRGDFLSYKMDSQKSSNKYTQTINDLNQTISEIKDKLFAHQQTISILSQQKEDQIKLYKTRKDKKLDKVIALENKLKKNQCWLAQFHNYLNEEMVADLGYFNSLELEVDSLRSQLETQKTQFLNEID